MLDRYGIPGVVLAAFGFGAWYVLRRLFNSENGILTVVGERHVRFLDSSETFQKELSESNNRLATTAETAHDQMKERNSLLGTLVEQHNDDGSPFATVKLHRAGLAACDVLEQVAESLEIAESAKSPIALMRRELGAE
jgi:hypothetical protein